MSLSSYNHSDQPMMEMNTTPLIDVMLVLLIMFIMTIPLTTHSVEVALPGGSVPIERIDPTKNHIVLTRDNAIMWNGAPIAAAQLLPLLKASLALPIEPELQFQPEADASYDVSARVLAIIKSSQVTRFGFVGNDQFAEFAKSAKASNH
jgi:biopolymer transport protein ExbD